MTDDEKRTIKNEYKEIKSVMGVYRLFCSGSGMAYIGAGKDVYALLNRHRAELRLGTHRNRQLSEDWGRYGEQSFSFEIIRELKPSEDRFADYNKELKALTDRYIADGANSGMSVIKI